MFTCHAFSSMIVSVVLTIALGFNSEVMGVMAQDAAPGQIIEGTVNPYGFQPENDFVAVDAETADLGQLFEDLGPVAREWYQHVMTLSGPYFEGRAPGSAGIERAADYVQFWFERLGLEPAFAEDGKASRTWTSYRQFLELPGGKPTIERALMQYRRAEIGKQTAEIGKDFTVLGNSGTADVSAPLAFLGYAIEEGPDGYSSFPDAEQDGEELAGRIAIILRYEPLDEEGRSRFTSRRFSRHAAIPPKMKAAVDRGAVGIILVNPPGAVFAKDGLQDVAASRAGNELDIPVVQVTPEIASRLIAGSDSEGRDLAALRRIADEGGHGSIIFSGKSEVRLATAIDGGMNRTANIGGVLRGRGDLADEWVIIGGHYDHVGLGTFGAMPNNRGRLHPGADDNASGTGGVIVTTQLLAERYANADADADLRSILFIAFTGEESGLNGSRYYVEHPTLPAGSINAMLNMDMIGRMRSDTLAIGGTSSADGMLEEVRPMLEKSGLTVHADPNGRGPSDHASFYGAGIPVLFFFTGTHDVYHQPGDYGWTVNPAGAARVIDLVVNVAEHFATDSERLVFGGGRPTRVVSKPTNEDAGKPDPNDRGYAPVRLGVRPGMGAGDEPGVRIEGVSENTSASEAGLRKGDVIIAWGGEDLIDVMDMVTRLRAQQPGDVVEMVVVRDGEEMTIPVTMKASEKVIEN
jgi:membrane-associated protease RseP (regulator of RpoE activity)